MDLSIVLISQQHVRLEILIILARVLRIASSPPVIDHVRCISDMSLYANVLSHAIALRWSRSVPIYRQDIQERLIVSRAKFVSCKHHFWGLSSRTYYSFWAEHSSWVVCVFANRFVASLFYQLRVYIIDFF